MSRLYLATSVIIVVVAQCVAGYTLPDQAQDALTFATQMRQVGPAWVKALESWTCPTPASSSNSSCDPCGVNSWWGNFDHLGCRGRTLQGVDDELGGDGYITNIHVTDLHIEGPVPEQTCIFKYLKELDLDGGNLTGTIPEFLSYCFPEVNEIDLSYNQLTGTVPAFLSQITSLTELELESNQLTGTVPPELAILPNVTSLRFENNNFHGTLPQAYRNLTDTLFYLLLYNNNFEGDLSMFSDANLGVVSTSDNPNLCGMVPAAVRWAHGYNPHNTSLGQPCPPS